MLRRCGCTVFEAPDGEIAWHVLRSEDIRLVVSDWIMPNLSGIDLCRRIRTADFGHYIYVILCTSKGEIADYIAGMDAGADDFMVKPISSEELRVRVRAGERVLHLERRLADKNRELENANAALQSAYERIENDIKAAAWVQHNLLPPPDFKAQGVACSWCFRPSSYMSGDIFNFFAVDERHVGFYLLDVSGHGVPAALRSVALSLVLTPDGAHNSPLKRYDADCGGVNVVRPSEVISELNERFQAKDDKYFTMSYGVFDSRTSLLHLAQAGNPNPVLIRQGREVKTLSSGGMPVGLWPDIDFDSVEIPFTRGDRLVLYSDGISECANANREEFGDARLLDYLSTTTDLPLGDMLNGLERELERWHGSAEFEDDVSLLALELIGEDIS
jgi:sigma-B regulation protein RsbU (phosphoserine phosphatase)